MHIVLIGASGFVGQYLVRKLVRRGHTCDVLSRHPSRRRGLRTLPNARLLEADVHDPGELTSCFSGAGAVVSMAGILNEDVFGGDSFERVHVDLVRSIVEAAGEAGVSRVLHISAINAGEGESRYLMTKGEGEKVLLDSGLDVSIYRPSVIFGPGDSFFNRFAALLRLTPVLPLACSESRLQPVYVGDVVEGICGTLESHGAQGPVMEFGGPKIYTLGELVRWTAKTMGWSRFVPGLPDPLARLQALAMNVVPGRPFSLDNYRSLQSDNVAEPNALPELGIEPQAVEAIVPRYLGLSPRQRRLDDARRRSKNARR